MKLLRRTVRNYIIYSALLLLICTPLYYLAIRQLFINEMEDELFHHKTNFIETIAKLKTERDIEFYQLINEEFTLHETKHWPISDSLFSYSYYDEKENKEIPFRALRTGVEIHDKQYELIIKESLLGNTKLVAAIVSIQTLLLALMLLGFILINRKLSKVIWDPFYTILDRLKQYKIEKDLPLEIPVTTTAEFRDLRDAIIQLVNKSRDAFLSQKEFTENASHELQTPLAIIRSKLELLMQANEMNSEQAELISNLLDATDRISRLNKNLLLLSKIENNQFISTQLVSINYIVMQLINMYKPIASTRQITFITHSKIELTKNTNPILLETLIGNLISNAVRHSPEHSEIIITIEKTTLTISNGGTPLKYPDKIFERFNREAKTSQGSGLGLAIVKKICDLAFFEIHYDYSNNYHHFTLTF